MTNDKLRAAFESLGYQNVRSVISSGNIIFETEETDSDKLEKEIEAALQSQLGIGGRTMVRSQEQLAAFVESVPFGSLEHARTSYLLVTFFKHKLDDLGMELPFRNQEYSFELLLYDKDIRALCSVSDVTTDFKTPDFMALIEKRFTKDVTSRTWLTILRVLKKF